MGMKQTESGRGEGGESGGQGKTCGNTSRTRSSRAVEFRNPCSRRHKNYIVNKRACYPAREERQEEIVLFYLDLIKGANMLQRSIPFLPMASTRDLKHPSSRIHLPDFFHTLSGRGIYFDSA